MNKCEQSQININKMISEMAKKYEAAAKNSFYHSKFPEFESWRKQLMTI